ncbi:hypothetical protein [Nocardia sp. NPDC051570]|uniref:hypothetical protein n=1 Tax=Nocardia sp. NPDC051570 TaxID=3364324 RepID=UPI0037BAAC6A
MNKFGMFTAAVVTASGLAMSAAGLASAETTPAQPPVSTGSAPGLPVLLGQILSGSAGTPKATGADTVATETGSASGSSLSGAVSGAGNVAGTTATGSAGTGTGSALPLCVVNPTTSGCPQ